MDANKSEIKLDIKIGIGLICFVGFGVWGIFAITFTVPILREPDVGLQYVLSAIAVLGAFILMILSTIFTLIRESWKWGLAISLDGLCILGFMSALIGISFIYGGQVVFEELPFLVGAIICFVASILTVFRRSWKWGTVGLSAIALTGIYSGVLFLNLMKSFM